MFKNIGFYNEFYHFFQKAPVFTMNFTIKKHQFLLCFWKMGQSWTYVSSKTSVFTMNLAYFWAHVSKTSVFTMNSVCLLPKTKPKHIFVQKHQFLQWIMHTFSKTAVFTMNYAYFFPKQCLHLRGSYFFCKESFLKRGKSGAQKWPRLA